MDFSQYMDSNVVTGVLKLFLRELPVPVVSHDAYGEIMKATGEMLSIPIYGDRATVCCVCRLCDGMLHNIPSHNLHTQHTITQSTCMFRLCVWNGT